MKQYLLAEIKGKIDYNIIIVVEVNTPHTSMDRSSAQKSTSKQGLWMAH